jgi:ATP-dependent DNA ligase
MPRAWDLDGDGAFGDQARQPGEPSRWRSEGETAWMALRPALVCEVSYTQLTERRFRHATRFERWRPDKDPAECTFAQLERPEGPSFDDIVTT